MIETAGNEIGQDVKAQDGENGGRKGTMAAAERRGGANRCGDEAEQQKQRPGDQRQRFGPWRAGQPFSDRNAQGDGTVNQPRPVHDDAVGRRQSGLCQIEPGLPGKQVANLDEAHQAVGIGRQDQPGMRPERHRQGRGAYRPNGCNHCGGPVHADRPPGRFPARRRIGPTGFAGVDRFAHLQGSHLAVRGSGHRRAGGQGRPLPGRCH